MTTPKLPWQDGSYPGAAATAARVRRFAKITGLKPSNGEKRVFGLDYWASGGGHPQGADHTNVWRDDMGYIVTTEPYRTRDPTVLEEWCTAHGWDCRKVPELGMWNPPHTVLYLLAPPKNGGDIGRVLWRTPRP